jgi:hypothetical protein
MRVSNLQIYELLAGVFGLDGSCGVLNGSTETDSDESEDGAVAFADAKDVVLEVCAGCA